MSQGIRISIGQQLGQYQLQRLIGSGGFAEVYEGVHVKLHTSAAIKILLKTPLSENEQNRFLEEARTIARLEHPNIINVLDYGTYGQVPFMVMKLAQGGSVRRQYPRGTPMPLHLIGIYTKQVAAALQYAHEQNITHCDVKPENILLGGNQKILLCDFGLSVVSESESYRTTLLKESLDVAGTPSYMAPEQVRGERGPSIDQYALGVVIYEWLCGFPPFQGTPMEIVMHQRMDPPPSLCKKGLGISPEIEKVVLKALAKDPARRFANVHELATAFEQASSSPPPPPLPSRRDFLKYAGGGLSLGLVIGGSGAYFLLPPWQARPGGLPPGLTATPTPSSQGATSLNGSTPQAGSTPANGSTSSGPRLLLTYKGHTNEVDGLAWSPDGKSIASGSRDWQVHVWDAASGNRTYTYQGHGNWVFAVLYMSDGKRIASASADKTVQVWNTNGGGNVLTYRGHSATVIAIAASPDGKAIASASVDTTAQVWDAGSGKTLLTYKGTAEIDAVCFSPNGKYIASGGVDQKVQVWNAASSTTLLTFNEHTDTVDAVAWSPDGKYIASGGLDRVVRVWEAITGNVVATYQKHSDRIRSVAWSPDGTLIASASADTTVQVWDVKTQTTRLTYSHTNWVHCVQFSPDGARLASASADYTVQVWQL